MSSYVIGVRGCQHLGYDAAGYRRSRTTGWGQRVVDGHVAHRLTVQSMIDHGVDLSFDGGDGTHHSRPAARDIEVAHRAGEMLRAAGIDEIINSGNHCAGSGLDISAAAVMHRPDLGKLAVYPGGGKDGRAVGPHPGYYEIHQPVPGIALHVISHYGLDPAIADPARADGGIVVDPWPIPGKVNLLMSHGITVLQEKLFRVAEAHGEPRFIPAEWFDRGFDGYPISDFHSMEFLRGAKPTARRAKEAGWVAYTGSAVRRGWSDEQCRRGWLKVTVHGDGSTVCEPIDIWQRPQLELPVIDATGMSAADIGERIALNIASAGLHDDATLDLTGDGGAIARQRISNATAQQRADVRSQDGRWRNLAREAVSWTLDFPRAAAVEQTRRTTGGRTALGIRRADFAAELTARADRLAAIAGVRAGIREHAMSGATDIARSVVIDDTAAEKDAS